MRPFARSGAIIRVQLHDVEAETLQSLAEQLTVLLEDRATGPAAVAGSSQALLAQLGIGGSTESPLDPALARLLPNAYTNDHVASAEHRQLTELGLVDRKIANARTVASFLATHREELDDAAAQSWLRTLTDLRLTLAARLNIEEDGDEGTGDEAMVNVYDWLGYLQGMLLDEVELSVVE